MNVAMNNNYKRKHNLLESTTLISKCTQLNLGCCTHRPWIMIELMGNRGVSKNLLFTFLGSTQFYLHYYQLKLVTTTRYLVELGNYAFFFVFQLYFLCIYPFIYSGNYPTIYYNLPWNYPVNTL